MFALYIVAMTVIPSIIALTLTHFLSTFLIGQYILTAMLIFVALFVALCTWYECQKGWGTKHNLKVIESEIATIVLVITYTLIAVWKVVPTKNYIVYSIVLALISAFKVFGAWFRTGWEEA